MYQGYYFTLRIRIILHFYTNTGFASHAEISQTCSKNKRCHIYGLQIGVTSTHNNKYEEIGSVQTAESFHD